MEGQRVETYGFSTVRICCAKVTDGGHVVSKDVELVSLDVE